ncbi:MAG: hypothetical protein F6K50_35770 [Moorea sp. SIO3I7]|uniref:Uncharacterized protein n=2 Tax=Moorena TaxID=1155738 RepID=A0A1D8TKS4_9CYAN|nr:MULTISPECIES: hypothetical protein [Moorena]NEO00612.1 hypothetical protein [Moorena sp. SIO3I7]NEO93029.1 hypothetical protein [Moorena sp. SIO3G5]AOW98204.1 hypothetical protein BJP34_00985 [Moorena producens PAL-8-15-08-1]NEO17070.1 hypothetical protein [Moorena sp. SIO3E8]NEO75507.1 hypothetical protein [Moorena sp. SIO4G3]
MKEQTINQVIDQPIEELDYSIRQELTKLGNQAAKMGLIGGHGYYLGRYEILCKGQIFTLSPEEAYSYLKKLVAQHQR